MKNSKYSRLPWVGFLYPFKSQYFSREGLILGQLTSQGHFILKEG